MNGRNIKTGSFKKGEDAVSPVIGVILMVAITVILAAVIGAFVFGMGSGVKKTYIVAATATQINSTAIVVTYNGGPDADQVNFVNVTQAGNIIPKTTTTPSTILVDTDNNVGNVGSSATWLGGSGGKEDHVVVTATFMDGSTQIILDTYV